MEYHATISVTGPSTPGWGRSTASRSVTLASATSEVTERLVSLATSELATDDTQNVDQPPLICKIVATADAEWATSAGTSKQPC